MNRSARVVGVLSITLALAAAVIVFNIRRYPDRVQGQPTIGPATVQQAVAHDMSAPLASLTSGEQDGGANHSAPVEARSSKFEVPPGTLAAAPEAADPDEERQGGGAPVTPPATTGSRRQSPPRSTRAWPIAPGCSKASPPPSNV